MTKITVDIEYVGAYPEDDELNRAWLCPENIQLLINQNSSADCKVTQHNCNQPREMTQKEKNKILSDFLGVDV